ncbi:MAG: dihydrolipoamide acetyltransferase family protein [Longimicrobiales bacterium]
MSKEFRLQDPGEGIHEAEIIEVKVSSGDEVRDGDVIFVVDTDKAAVEVPAPFNGRVEEIRVEEDDVVEVGDVLLIYTEDEGDREDERDREDEGDREESAEEPSGERSEEEEPGKEPEERTEDVAEEEESGPIPASPATRRLARELDVDLGEVPGSGPQGRVTSDDVRSFAEGGAKEGGAAEEEREEEREEEKREEEPAEERKEAEERREEEEEGPGEGVEEEAPSLPFHTLVKKSPPLPDFSHWGPVRTEPLRRVRRNVARRMTMAWMEVPHVNHHQELDITELERFRKEHGEAVEKEGGQLTPTVLIMKAAVVALKEHPRFNASLDVEAEKIILKDYYNLGLAVDTPEGLVVPVVRNVDGKSLVELSVEVAEMAERVRNGDATQEDVQGGTFTVTNPGPIGGDSFTPILRYPEVAILGMAAAKLKPVVRGDLEDWEIVPRLMLPLVLAFDHRVNDGADAARFMNTLAETLEDMDSFLLNA